MKNSSIYILMYTGTDNFGQFYKVSRKQTKQMRGGPNLTLEVPPPNDERR